VWPANLKQTRQILLTTHTHTHTLSLVPMHRNTDMWWAYCRPHEMQTCPTKHFWKHSDSQLLEWWRHKNEHYKNNTLHKKHKWLKVENKISYSDSIIPYDTIDQEVDRYDNHIHMGTMQLYAVV